MSNPGSFSRDFALTVVSRMFAPIAALVTIPALAHSLGVEGRGELATATVPLLLCTAIATLGLPDAIAYFVASRGTRGRFEIVRAIPSAGTAGVLAVGLIWIAAPWLASGDGNLTRDIRLVALWTPVAVLVALARGRAIGLRQWRRVRGEQIINALCVLLGTSTLWALGALTLPTALVVFICGQIVGGLAYLDVFRRPKQDETQSPTPPRHVLQYAMSAWVATAAGVALTRLDQILMAGIADLQQLGLYVVAASVAEIPLILNGVITQLVFAHDAADQNADRAHRASRVGFLCAVLVALIVTSTAGLTFPFLFGAGFSAAIPAATILLASAAMSVPGSTAGSALAARGAPGLRSAGILIGLVVNVVVLVALAGPLGATGAAIATFAASMTAGGWMLFWVERRAGLKASRFIGVRAEDLRTLRDILSRPLTSRLNRRRA